MGRNTFLVWLILHEHHSICVLFLFLRKLFLWAHLHEITRLKTIHRHISWVNFLIQIFRCLKRVNCKFRFVIHLKLLSRINILYLLSIIILELLYYELQIINNFQLYSLLILCILHDNRYLERSNHWNITIWLIFQLKNVLKASIKQRGWVIWILQVFFCFRS